MTYTIRWEGEPRPDLEDVLRKDMEQIEEDLDGDMRNLITHVCVLTEDFDGPSIHAYGDLETGEVVAEYSESTKWMSMADWESSGDDERDGG